MEAPVVQEKVNAGDFDLDGKSPSHLLPERQNQRQRPNDYRIAATG
jgi:hypothetical protein